MNLSIEDRLSRIEQILTDNKQHQRFCPAHLTASDMSTPFGSMFMSQREASCDCWISAASPSTDPTKGFGIYKKSTEQLQQHIFPSRYVAVETLCWANKLSRDPKSENFYGKDYFITDVVATPAPSTPERNHD